MIFILGASGFIGNYLYQRLKEEGFRVGGTYFRNKKEGLIYFDLASMRLADLKLGQGKINYLIIAAAAAVRIDEAKRNWESAYNTDVVRTREVIDYCFQEQIIPIYISTDNVFSGSKGKYKETDQRNPINCYGRIRQEVENYLLDSVHEFIILRVGKVFGIKREDGTFITAMVKSMQAGEALSCADDQIFTPLYIQELFDFIKRIIAQGQRGIFHLSSIKATTRYEIAKTIKNYFHFKDAQINRCKINSLGLLEKRPLKVGLDDAKHRSIIGSGQKELTDYLKLFKLNQGALKL